MIDWSKLKPYQDNKYRSFEELCYQIAKRLHSTRGEFTYIDDSGGGDGVEFYMTMSNGDQWGWQEGRRATRRQGEMSVSREVR